MTRDWHSYFAWRPVRTPTGWVWLHWVDRRAIDVEWADFYGPGDHLIARYHEYRRKHDRA